MAGVQFFGKQKVIEAYKDRGIETWSLWAGKDLLASGDSEDTLAIWLRHFDGTPGTYKLKVHKDCDDPDSLTDKDACNGVFQFKLVDPYNSAGIGGMGDPALLARIAALEKGNAPQEEEKTFMGAVMNLLYQPDKLAAVIQGIGGMLRGAPPSFPMMQAIGQVFPAPVRAGTSKPEFIQPEKITAMPELSEKDFEKVGNAVDRLYIADPKIVLHLEKLATLAEAKPDLFKMLLMQLDGI